MIGYHIEVTATHADKLDLAALGFTRRQSMSNATRFSTAELADLETRIGRAADQALAMELAIFDDPRGRSDRRLDCRRRGRPRRWPHSTLQPRSPNWRSAATTRVRC